MRLLKTALLLSSAFCTSQAFAAETLVKDIVELKAFPDQLLVTLDGTTHVCGGTAGHTFRIYQDAEAQVRLAFAAFLAGRQVKIDYSCVSSGAPTGAYVNIIVTN